jgi:hypothetical protein
MPASNMHPKNASAYAIAASGSRSICTPRRGGLQENAVALVDDAMAKALQKRASEVG